MPIKHVLALLLSSTLIACGGGGGSPDTTTTEPDTTTTEPDTTTTEPDTTTTEPDTTTPEELVGNWHMACDGWGTSTAYSFNSDGTFSYTGKDYYDSDCFGEVVSTLNYKAAVTYNEVSSAGNSCPGTLYQADVRLLEASQNGIPIEEGLPTFYDILCLDDDGMLYLGLFSNEYDGSSADARPTDLDFEWGQVKQSDGDNGDNSGTSTTEPDTSTSEPDTTTPEELVGNWLLSCDGDGTSSTYSFNSDGTLHSTLKDYDADDCSGAASATLYLEAAATYKEIPSAGTSCSGTLHQADLSQIEVKFNGSPWSGAPSNVYDIICVNSDGKLYFGSADEGKDGLSAGARPTVISLESAHIKQ